jgi:hypothetical protein
MQRIKKWTNSLQQYLYAIFRAGTYEKKELSDIEKYKLLSQEVENLETEVENLRYEKNILQLVVGDKNKLLIMMILYKTLQLTTTEFLSKTSKLDLNSAQDLLETLEYSHLIKNLPYKSYQITGLGQIIMEYICSKQNQ